MKVLFITTSFPRSFQDPIPAGNFILYLAEHLQKKGVEITVLAPHLPDTPTEYFIGDIQVKRVKYLPESVEKLTNTSGGIPQLIKKKDPRLLFTPVMISAMSWKIIRLFQAYDIIHPHWLFNIFPVIPAQKIKRKPCIVTVHGSDAVLVENFPWIGNTLAKNCDIAVTVNMEQIKIIKKWFKNVHYIPNGVKDNFAPLPEGDEVIIGAVGHFSKIKNFKTLAEALKLLYKKEIKFKAYFVGDGDERGVIESIIQPFKDKVTITGYLPNENVLNLLKQFHIFVLPSFSEGRSIALLEAMATGRAIVASSIPQNREIIKNGANGLLFDPNSSQELAEKLIMLINNKQMLIKMAKNSYNTIKELGLTWEKTAEKYYELYRELLKEAK